MSAPHAEPADLSPLGGLAPVPGGPPWTGDSLDLDSPLPPAIRSRVATYLEACPVFLAWMEHTRDVIGDRFGVDGGSAIASDGRYYWRLDAGAYVGEYGVVVPSEALAHFEAVGWRPPTFEREDYLRIYRTLEAMFGGNDVVG